MRFDRPLDGILGARSKVALLRLLVRTRSEQTGSELARQVGFDAKTCHTALQELAGEGVVVLRRAGSAILYRLNEGHALVGGLLVPLFEGEGSFLADYAKDLRAVLEVPVVALILFGSVARMEERATSDMDLLLIVPSAPAARKAMEAVDQAAVDLASKYGSAPQVLVYDRKAFGDLARRGDRFVSEVLRTGRVIHGKPFSEILKHVS